MTITNALFCYYPATTLLTQALTPYFTTRPQLLTQFFTTNGWDHRTYKSPSPTTHVLLASPHFTTPRTTYHERAPVSHYINQFCLTPFRAIRFHYGMLFTTSVRGMHYRILTCQAIHNCWGMSVSSLTTFFYFPMPCYTVSQVTLGTRYLTRKIMAATNRRTIQDRSCCTLLAERAVG